MPQFDTKHFVSQVFWALLCFGFLWSLVYFWAMPRLQEIYKKRSLSAKDFEGRAQNIEKQVQDIVDSTNVRLEKVQRDASQMVQEIKDHNQEEIKKILETSRQSYKKHIERAEESLNKQIQEAQGKILEEVPSLVRACVNRYHSMESKNSLEESP